MKTLFLLLFLSMPVLAQAPEPLLNVEEQLRLENLQLKFTLLNIEKDRIQIQINANHPGYNYDMSTGKFVKLVN